ncbi:unnamed protein product [Pleuronectes platessa]|uniref:Uncharacterized protein n=1 Tax=Pleuronectes platessa TaxID=8262 RepID=A0A9N7V713_PLEPL|nr:unnamed protein product [Pleuronectes platessa]
MRVSIPKNNPNMTCQAVPLQSQSMVSNQQDNDPPSRPERHSSPQSPSIATLHEPPPRSWSNARTRCQRDTGSATTTTISPHDTESATLGPPPRPPVRDQQTAIHGCPGSAGDKAKGFRGRGIGMEKRTEKLEK